MCALLLVLLTACGGSDGGSNGNSDNGPAGSATAKPTGGAAKEGAAKKGEDTDESGDAQNDADAVASEGKPAPTALTDFQCRADDDGDWSATGHLKNSSKKPVTFQVTVVVRPDEDDDEGKHKATTQQFDSIQPKGSVRISMDDLRAPKDAKQCFVRVMALAS